MSRLLKPLTKLKPSQSLLEPPNKGYLDRFSERVAELVAKQIASQIASEIPRIVESVSRAAAVEAVAVAREMPKATADAILHVLSLGRL